MQNLVVLLLLLKLSLVVLSPTRSLGLEKSNTGRIEITLSKRKAIANEVQRKEMLYMDNKTEFETQ